MESDAELIAASLAGDGEAFMEVIGRHQAAVGAYLTRRVGRDVAADLLGEWIAAFESLDAYDRSFAGARPWLFRLALNRLRRYWRSRAAEDLVPDTTDLAGRWDPWPAVDARFDTRTVMRAALARLKPEEREVLTLVVWEDLTAADAARTLGMPHGTARRLLHQARLALRDVPEVVNSRLITVADVIKSHEGPLPGNASLILRTQTNGGVPTPNYDLYTDSGDYYYGETRSALIEAVASHDNISGGMSAREVAAALYAANGDLTAARVRMINATPNPFGLGDTPAQKKALAKQIAADHAALRKRDKSIKISPPAKGKALQEDYDNYIFNNCMDALTKGGGNPQVRIGVLRLLSTVPEVTVKGSTTAGVRTLTLTASTALFGGLTNDVLTINASTGMPISSVSGIPGQPPASITTYQISRVTLADIAASKF